MTDHFVSISSNLNWNKRVRGKEAHTDPKKVTFCMGVGGAVRFFVVGTIGKEERPPRGQLWMEQYLISPKYWPI